VSCQTFRAITPTPMDVALISDSLVNQILAHNRAGAAKGCWESPE